VKTGGGQQEGGKEDKKGDSGRMGMGKAPREKNRKKLG
jgi:hypothetical protein